MQGHSSTKIIAGALLACHVGIFTLACSDTQTVDRRIIEPSSDELRRRDSATLRINLPEIPEQNGNLGDVSDAEKVELNAAYIALKPSSPNCQDIEPDELIIELPHKESFVEFETLGGCSYFLDIKLGYQDLEGKSKRRSELVTYDQNIASLVEKNCASCHADFNTYERVHAKRDDILFQIEEGLMPPEDDMPLDEVLIFSAWKAFGFLRIDQDLPSKDSLESNLTYVFYRNQANIRLDSNVLMTRREYVYKDKLLRQQYGERYGFQEATLNLPSE